MARRGFKINQMEQMDRFFADCYDDSSENLSQAISTAASDGSVLFGHLQGTVVGLRYYTGVVNQGEMVSLKREPYNPHDSNAVMVTNIYGDEVGHIKWELAEAMAYVMDNNLAKVKGVHYETKNRYTMLLTLSFWGMEENRNDVIESMAHCGFIPEEMEQVDLFTDCYDDSSENLSQAISTAASDGSVLFGHLKGTVVGLRHYTGVVKQGEMVNLEREPHNPYDFNAVMVTNIYGNQVGHIKRKLAEAMAYVMDNDLAEVEGVVHYGTKGKYTVPLTLSFWGKEENKNDVIGSMDYYGFILKEMEPPSAQPYGQGRGYQAGGYGQPGNQRGSDEYYHWGWCGAQQGGGMQFRGVPPHHPYSPSYPQNQW